MEEEAEVKELGEEEEEEAKAISLGEEEEEEEKVEGKVGVTAGRLGDAGEEERGEEEGEEAKEEDGKRQEDGEEDEEEEDEVELMSWFKKFGRGRRGQKARRFIVHVFYSFI